MKKETFYYYVGTNGTILSPVHLEGIHYVEKIKLSAEDGMILSNGLINMSEVTVFNDEISEWKEVPKGQE